MIGQELVEVGEELREYAMSLGVEVYGVASADLYKEYFPEKPQPEKFIPGAKSVIVVGMAFNKGTLATVVNPNAAGLKRKAADDVTNAGQIAGVERYFSGEENGILDRELNLIAYRLARKLEREGNMAMHLPTSKKDTRWYTAPFYHIPAAYLAGLGTMGLNCCLVSPEYGPRLWLTSIITDKELPTGEPLEEDVCTKCGDCVVVCPSKALDGEGWKNVYQCAAYGCCGSCLAICSIGSK
ncbi:4Fe-4S binding protein [Candidatus Poribacteria bacterium]